MPHPSTPLGPFPPGVDEVEYDRRRRRILWSLPTGLYLLGARADARRSVMTVNLVCQVATEPKLLGASIETNAQTAALVHRGGAFTVMLLARADRELVRRFVRVPEHDPAEALLGGERYLDAPVTGSPVLERALAYLDCRIVDRLEYASHSFVVGQVVDANWLAPGPDETEILRMEDTRMNYGG